MAEETLHTNDSHAQNLVGRNSGRQGGDDINAGAKYQFNAKGMSTSGPVEANDSATFLGKSTALIKAGGLQASKDSLRATTRPSPITVGPLTHRIGAGPSSVTAGRGVNNKIRKIQNDKGNNLDKSGVVDTELHDTKMEFNPGKPPDSEGEISPAIRKTMKNRTGIVLGVKRKTVTIAQRESNSITIPTTF